MSFGKGAVYTASSKQKIDTGSSTHAELVGTLDAIPKIPWVRRFMEAQGYVIKDVYVYQDNESAIVFEEKNTNWLEKHHTISKLNISSLLIKLGAKNYAYITDHQVI